MMRHRRALGFQAGGLYTPPEISSTDLSPDCYQQLLNFVFPVYVRAAVYKAPSVSFYILHFRSQANRSRLKFSPRKMASLSKGAVSLYNGV